MNSNYSWFSATVKFALAVGLTAATVYIVSAKVPMRNYSSEPDGAEGRWIASLLYGGVSALIVFLLMRSGFRNILLPKFLSVILAIVCAAAPLAGLASPETPRQAGDYDADGRADFVVWRPSTGQWFVRGQKTVKLGMKGDIAVPGDYNGDRRVDRAVWRPGNGTWLIEGEPDVRLGHKGDVPVPGDYDGDGKVDTVVWRPRTGQWLTRMGILTAFGRQGDIPVPSDYDGDGSVDVAVWRPKTGQWFIQGAAAAEVGKSGDIPVPANIDGTNRRTSKPLVWRPTTGEWLSSTGRVAVVGAKGDIPFAADSDGDAIADLGTWSPGPAKWTVGNGAFTYGRKGDVPLAGLTGRQMV